MSGLNYDYYDNLDVQRSVIKRLDQNVINFRNLCQVYPSFPVIIITFSCAVQVPVVQDEQFDG